MIIVLSLVSLVFIYVFLSEILYVDNNEKIYFDYDYKNEVIYSEYDWKCQYYN